MACVKSCLVSGFWMTYWILAALMNGMSVATDPAYASQYASDSMDYYGDSYMSDWSKDWAMLSGRINQPKCIDIPSNMTLCRGIGYTQMRLPNLLDHDSVQEVVQQAGSWGPLLGIQCHPDTRLFLCSLFSPVCLDRPIWPCRSLCNAVKTNCEGFMNKYGFPWPEMLRCDKFPLDNDLCIGQQSESNKDDRVCVSCGKPVTFESLIHNYCDSEFVLKLRLDENVIVGGNMKLVPGRKKKVLKAGNLTKSSLRRLELFISNGLSCDCPAVANVSKSLRDYHLVMGHMQGGKAEIDFISVYDKRNNDIRKAVKTMQSKDICQNGLKGITGDSENEGTSETSEGNAVTADPTPVTEPERRVCESCGKSDIYEDIINNCKTSDYVLKLRLHQQVMEANNLKLIPKKKKKVLKKGSLTRSALRRLDLFIANGLNCNCPAVANVSESQRDYHLIMGHMEGGKAHIDYITLYDRENRDMKKAIRAMRKSDICYSGDSSQTHPRNRMDKDLERRRNHRRLNRRRKGKNMHRDSLLVSS